MRIHLLACAASLLAPPEARAQPAGELTLAWATPIMRLQLEPEDAASLTLVSDQILSRWEMHKELFTPTADKTLADSFFLAQRDSFEEDGQHLLATLEGSAGEIVRGWHTQWLARIMEFVEAASGPDAARSLREKQLKIFAWAGVHERCSRGHEPHLHEHAHLSGAFYLAVDQPGGAFVAEDPRGPRPPFDQTLSIEPKAGELLLFPSWMRHSVEPVGHCVGDAADDAARRARPRVVISFNLGPRPFWGPEKVKYKDDKIMRSEVPGVWRTLADSSLAFSIGGDDAGGESTWSDAGEAT